MKLRFGIVFALLAVLVVGANVGGVGQVKAQFGGSPLPGFPPGVFQNRAALDAPARSPVLGRIIGGSRVMALMT